MIDEQGFRQGVAMVIINEHGRVFWARRYKRQGWQFPQGGLETGETPLDAMYRELYEEVGLKASDVELMAESKRWLHYYLPAKLVRQSTSPVCIGQRQKWYLLRVNSRNTRFAFDKCAHPEFDSFRWVSYWYPLRQVIFFKKHLYRRALKEFAPLVLDESQFLTIPGDQT